MGRGEGRREGRQGGVKREGSEDGGAEVLREVAGRERDSGVERWARWSSGREGKEMGSTDEGRGEVTW